MHASQMGACVHSSSIISASYRSIAAELELAVKLWLSASAVDSGDPHQHGARIYAASEVALVLEDCPGLIAPLAFDLGRPWAKNYEKWWLHFDPPAYLIREVAACLVCAVMPDWRRKRDALDTQRIHQAQEVEVPLERAA